MNILTKYIKTGQWPKNKNKRAWIIVGIPSLVIAQTLWYLLMEWTGWFQFTQEVNIIAFVIYSLIFTYKGTRKAKK